MLTGTGLLWRCLRPEDPPKETPPPPNYHGPYRVKDQDNNWYTYSGDEDRFRFYEASQDFNAYHGTDSYTKAG